MSPTVSSGPRRTAADARVSDAMHLGVVTCAPDASLAEVARVMARYAIHCVVIDGAAGEGEWGIVSDVDLVAAAGRDEVSLSAAELAATEPLTIAPDEPLAAAAQLMAEHEAMHLVVVDPARGVPVGVLSSLDIAGAIAGDGS